MDRNDLLATMYQDDESTAAPVPIDQGDQRSRKIRVGIIEYEVPTMAYVRHLEQIITQQAQMLTQHRRSILRLENTARGTRNFINRQADMIGMRNAAHKVSYSE